METVLSWHFFYQALFALLEFCSLYTLRYPLSYDRNNLSLVNQPQRILINLLKNVSKLVAFILYLKEPKFYFPFQEAHLHFLQYDQIVF